MIESGTVQLATVPVSGMEGAIWLRLHAEREDICETLLKHAPRNAQTDPDEDLLQARLREIDEALDGLMSVRTRR